jgi:hypothetical protein
LLCPYLLSTEPEPSDDDELDTEDGEVNTPGSSSSTIQRARVGHTEATKNTPLSAPPAFASTSSNAAVDNSRLQMKRKELESLFTSKKRTRYASAPSSDQEDAMDLDPDEHTIFKTHSGINSKPASGILYISLLGRHVLIYLLRTKNHGWIGWLATWGLSVCFFDNNE